MVKRLEAPARLEEAAQLQRLEVVSMMEAATLITLIGLAVPLKHFFAWPLGVRVLGPIHGIAFLFYCWTVMQTVSAGGWRPAEVIRLFGVAFVPLAGFFNVGWIRRRRADLLTGEWDQCR